MRFTKWVNPKNSQVRVYVNGSDFASHGVKVFVLDGGPSGTDKFASEGFPDIRIQADFMISQSQVDSIMNEIDDFVKAAVQSDVNPVFADYLSLAQ